MCFRLISFSFNKSRRVQPQVALAGCHRWGATALLFLVLAGAAPAQEALRYSLAGQDVAEYRKRQLENQKFSLELGPVSMRFEGGLEIDVTDNVKYVSDNPQEDLIFRPQLKAFSSWRVSERNTLSLGLGIGYEKYLNTTEYDRFFISPDTDLSFDIYAGDFLINLHDQFNYTGDVSSSPTISGTGSLPRFENTVGIRTVWDLNKAFISVSYDHQNYIATDSVYDYLTHSAELLTATVGFQLRPTVQAGLQLGGGLIDYTQPLSQDNQHVSIGPFVSAQLSENTSFRLGGGYVMYFLDTLGLTDLTSSVDAYYLEASLNQRVSKLLTHSLSFGQSLQSQFGSGRGSQLLDSKYIAYSASWNLLRKTALYTTLRYEHDQQSGLLGETFDWFGTTVSLSRPITQSLSATLGYQFHLKDSDRKGSDYLQNRLVLSLAYAF